MTEHDDVERGMLPEERARVQARLDAGMDKSSVANLTLSDPAPDPALIIDITPGQGSPDRKPPLWIAAAAALVVLAGLFFLTGPRQSNDEVAVVAEVAEPTPVPVPSPTPVPTCPTAVDDFVVAVDSWDGIEQWASLIDERRPDPDLPTLAAAAIAEWETLAPGSRFLEGLEIEVEEPPGSVSESQAALTERRVAPLQLAFDRMRLASRDASSALGPCSERIEIVAQELNLVVLSPDGE